jgi:aldehyde:ferredoxin oxidoreductase
MHMENMMIEITINNQKTQVKEGTSILKVASAVGIDIPTLCSHEFLKPYGACRLCLVEVHSNGQKSIVTSCDYTINSPIEVFTDTPDVLEARKGVIQLMLAKWPETSAVKAIATKNGVEKPPYEHPKPHLAKDACILCGRCVRMCSEGIWESIIAFAGKNGSRRVAMPFDKYYDRCLGCGACAWICPAGAIKVYDERNNPVSPKRIRNYGMKVTGELIRFDDVQCRMRKVGTGNLTEIMNNYDLLPTHNYQYGGHEEAHKIDSKVWTKMFTQHSPEGCWLGCSMSCSHVIDNFELRTGPYKGQIVIVDGPEYETIAGCGSNIGIFDPHYVAEINFYCDTYGIDTISFGTATAFAMECYERGIINSEITGGIDLRFGNHDAALEILHQMSRGEGFGVIIGRGVKCMKELFAKEYGADKNFLDEIGMENKGLEFSEYVCKESLAQQGGYCMTNKGPQHDEAWLIFMDQVNNQIPTFEDKADALHYFPMFRTWFGLLGLCKLPWNDVLPEDNARQPEAHKIPGHVKGYLNYFEGMTGRTIDADEMIRQSERVYNFQRIFNIRLGKGRREHDYVPFRAMGPVTKEEYLSRQERYDKQLRERIGVNPENMTLEEKMRVLKEYRKDQYSQLQDAVYKRRGWTKDGIPTVAKLKELRIDLPELLEIVRRFPGVE